MLDPEPAGRAAPPHHGSPPSVLGGGKVSPTALQILMTEHWSLLGSRSMGYVEAMARASMFIAALSGAVVALALVAQATDFGDGFVAFALVLLLSSSSSASRRSRGSRRSTGRTPRGCRG